MQNLVDPAADPAVDDGPRRGRILWALATCMAEKGYQATTIADIARAARVSKTVVYRTSATRSTASSSCTPARPTASSRRCAPLRRPPPTCRGATGSASSPATYLETLAGGPAVAWAALVEVQAAGRSALTLRRDVIDRYVDLLTGVAGQLAEQHPAEVRPISRELVLAAVGGINELMLARVERGQAERLPEDAGVAADVLIGLLERR